MNISINLNISEEYINFKVRECLSAHAHSDHLVVQEIIEHLIADMKTIKQVELYELLFKGISTIIDNISIRKQMYRLEQPVGYYTDMIAKERYRSQITQQFKGI